MSEIKTFEATPDQLLKDTITRGYEPTAYASGYYASSSRPPFGMTTIGWMLQDPRILFGLMLIKGPILSNAHVKVDCEDEIVRQFIVDQINEFWLSSAKKALKAVEWGYSSCEVLYKEKDGLVHFDALKDFYPPDCRVMIHEGKMVGIIIRNNNLAERTFLGFPKAFHHIHERERNPWYGLSRLFGAHAPWWEIWSDGGYRDIRRLWYHKNAFEGGIMRHPPGDAVDSNGLRRSNKDLAREMIEKKRTGGVLVFPSVLAGEGGSYAWAYEPPTANPSPEGLLEYGDNLRDELFEALGIPPEVVQSGGDQGFGSSTGRQVPQTAFYAILQNLLQDLLNDLREQVLSPLIALNFGREVPFKLLPFKLSEDLSTEQSAPDFNGNQFQDENQRSVFMAHNGIIHGPNGEIHALRQNRWWTMRNGVVVPMSVAI